MLHSIFKFQFILWLKSIVLAFAYMGVLLNIMVLAVIAIFMYISVMVAFRPISGISSIGLSVIRICFDIISSENSGLNDYSK